MVTNFEAIERIVDYLKVTASASSSYHRLCTSALVAIITSSSICNVREGSLWPIEGPEEACCIVAFRDFELELLVWAYLAWL